MYDSIKELKRVKILIKDICKVNGIKETSKIREINQSIYFVETKIVEVIIQRDQCELKPKCKKWFFKKWLSIKILTKILLFTSIVTMLKCLILLVCKYKA